VIYVRAHDLEILPFDSSDGLPAAITRITLTGGMASIAARLNTGTDVEIELPRWSLEHARVAPGQLVRLKPRRFGVFGPSTGGHPCDRAAPAVARPQREPAAGSLDLVRFEVATNP